jgi:predicted site-specific integrase-resolvase
MKSKEVLQMLNIKRPTLTALVKAGKIRVTKLENGFYDYNKEDVMQQMKKNKKTINICYARVAHEKYKENLENQITNLEAFCASKGVQINKIFKEIGSGLSINSASFFSELLELVINNQVDKVFVTYRDRLSRTNFDFFEKLFKKYGTQIIVINEAGNEKIDEIEFLEELNTLLKYFAISDKLDIAEKAKQKLSIK